MEKDPRKHQMNKKEKTMYFLVKAEDMRSKGRMDDAKIYLDEARKINSKIRDKTMEAFILETFAYFYSDLGEYEKSIKATNDAIAIYEQLSGNVGRWGNLNGLTHLGTIYARLGKYEEAITYLEKAIAKSMEIKDEISYGIALGNLGEVYNEKKEHEKALQFCQKALEIGRKTRDKYEEARNLHNIGCAYKAMGKYKKSIMYCEESSRIFTEIGHQNVASISHGVVADVYAAIGDLNISEARFKSCIDTNIRVKRFQELSITYGNKALMDFQIALSIFLTFKDVTKLLESCIQNFKKAIESSDKILVSLAVDSNKTAFSDKFYRWYDHLTGPFNLLGRPAAALLFLDLGRAKILRHLVYKQVEEEEQDKNFESSWLTIENKHEKERICTISKQIELPNSNATVLFYNFNAKKILTIWILHANGSVYLKTSDPSSKDVESGEELEENINKLLKKTSDRIPRGYSFIQQSIQENTGEDTSRNRLKKESVDSSEKSRSPAKATNKSFDDFTKDPRFLLHRSLIDPVKGFIQGTKLIIVPQSCIFFAPFSSFIDKDKRLLSEQYQIQIIPSFHVLAISMQATRKKQIGASLFIGNPATHLSPLPSAEDEVKHLASLLDAKPIIGREATRSKLMESLPAASIIHIAAHGHNESGDIFLAPAELSQQSNATHSTLSFELLTQSDILQCKLSCARLVVLSCCHSGMGKLSSEGVLGIARSFLGAGASAVMVTLWPIDDAFTLEFMKIFYEKVFSQKSVCLALKETVNSFQRSGKYTSYLYWGAFEIIGEDVSFTKSDIEEIRIKNKFLDTSGGN